MPRNLKVFTWSDGFHAFTVATASRPKALAAWGVRQDIFKSGLAREIYAGPQHDAALARPGEVIQSGMAVDVGKLEPARKRSEASPSKAARKRVADLERALEALDADHAEQAAELDTEVQQLERRREALGAAQKKERVALIARLKSARTKV